MGGGGGKAPEPKTFTPPPLNDGPAKNPIPNFFASAGAAGRPQSPYEALAALSQVIAPQSPFQGMSGGQQAPLLRREENEQPDIVALLKLLQQGQR